MLGELTGGRESAKESTHQVLSATIRVRNYPAVVAGDRLRDVRWDETWTINHVVPGDNEQVCDVTRPRWTASGGTAT